MQQAAVGVAENGNSAVLVTVTPNGTVLDRRRIDLTENLPTHPYHHEGSWAVGRYRDSPWARPTSLPDALALIDRVHQAAAQGARTHLAALAATLPITRIALRHCPPLPPTALERITDARAAAMADSILYRQALATAAAASGWDVHWYDRKHVLEEAATALACPDIDAFLTALGRPLGPPWQAAHRLAAAAAIAAAHPLANPPVKA